MKLIKKLLILILCITVLNAICMNKVFAEDGESLSSMISSADEFLTKGEDDVINEESLKSTSDYIYNTLLAIAMVVAVIAGSGLGIKFMIESAEDKAKIKEALIPFVVGCFVVFGAFGIWKVVVTIGNNISDNNSGFITPPTRGIVCPECGADLGDIPAGVIAGGRKWTCPNCKKQVQDW